MTDILTLTLNPCVDISTATDHVEPGPKLRCAAPRRDPGGGGINVARAIRILGGEAVAFIATGGPTGDLLERLMRDEGLSPEVFGLPGDTRQSLAVTDRGTGEQFRFVMPGPEWVIELLDAALERIATLASPGALVVLSGSQPPGVPDDFPVRLANRLDHTAARLILDTSGPALTRFAASPNTGRRLAEVLRMDREEAEDLAHRALPTRTDSADFAQSLVHRGLAETVIVARGADGSTLATATERLHAETQQVPVKSKVGAGDSFVGGFALALSRGQPLADALRLGVTAASAAVMTEATMLCTAADVERLLPGCSVTQL